MELTSKVREELYFQKYMNDSAAPGGIPVMQKSLPGMKNGRKFSIIFLILAGVVWMGMAASKMIELQYDCVLIVTLLSWILLILPLGVSVVYVFHWLIYMMYENRFVRIFLTSAYFSIAANIFPNYLRFNKLFILALCFMKSSLALQSIQYDIELGILSTDPQIISLAQLLFTYNFLFAFYALSTGNFWIALELCIPIIIIVIGLDVLDLQKWFDLGRFMRGSIGQAQEANSPALENHEIRAIVPLGELAITINGVHVATITATARS